MNSFLVSLPHEYQTALAAMAQESELSVPQMLRVLIREGQALRHPAPHPPKYIPSEQALQQAPKQVLVLRKDLNMRKGKMVAQGAHASWKAVLQGAAWDETTRSVTLRLDAAGWEWLTTGRFKKVCVGVPDEQSLFEVHRQACLRGLPCQLIQDAGLTEFKQPTFTALAVGPGWPQDVDAVTGMLPLL